MKEGAEREMDLCWSSQHMAFGRMHTISATGRGKRLIDVLSSAENTHTSLLIRAGLSLLCSSALSSSSSSLFRQG